MGLYSASSAFRSLQQNTVFGAVGWTNPANGRAVDGAFATATLNPGQQTNELELWQLLTISVGGVNALRYLTGLEVQVTVGTSPGVDKIDLFVRLYEHTVGAISDWKSTSISGGILDTYILGGDGDLWSVEPTWAMIQNKNFGVQLYYDYINLFGAGAEAIEHDGVAFKYYYNRRYGLASQGSGV